MLKKLSIIIYICIVAVLIAATIIEHTCGTHSVQEHIYRSTWFYCMWGIGAVTVAITLFTRFRTLSRLPLFLIHASFLIIFCGASITFLFSEKGTMHLREGMTESHFTESVTGHKYNLPFKLRLDSFHIKYYPGTQAPADYISHITYLGEGKAPVTETISMNKVLKIDGYTFYQTSFDKDCRGSLISVNHDPIGTTVAYIGYMLLSLSMLLLIATRIRKFKQLFSNSLLQKSVFSLIIAVAPAISTYAQDGTTLPPAPSRTKADSLAREQIIYNNRITPLNTLARDFILKLAGDDNYKGLSPEQVMVGWLQHPDIWQNEPIILIKDKQLQSQLGLNDERTSFANLLKCRSILSQEYWNEYGYDKTIHEQMKEVDEKVAIVTMLLNGTLIKPLPDDGSISPLSGNKINAELLYNRIPFNKITFIACLTLGMLAFAWLMYRCIRTDNHPGKNTINATLATLLLITLGFHAFGYGLRWYISGRIPLGNGYETMQFLALFALAMPATLSGRFPFIIPFGFLISGFTLLVAHLGQMDPQITPLVPVLVSPLLSSHVSLIMISYGLFAFIMLDAIVALAIMKWGNTLQATARINQLTALSRIMLLFAVLFLIIGIFLGSIWANISWGRYWGWDAKEVWALITLMIYSAAFHSSTISAFSRPRFFHAYVACAFFAVLFTYFGVKYLLGGIHSYA